MSWQDWLFLYGLVLLITTCVLVIREQWDKTQDD